MDIHEWSAALVTRLPSGFVARKAWIRQFDAEGLVIAALNGKPWGELPPASPMVRAVVDYVRSRLSRDEAAHVKGLGLFRVIDLPGGGRRPSFRQPASLGGRDEPNG